MGGKRSDGGVFGVRHPLGTIGETFISSKQREVHGNSEEECLCKRRGIPGAGESGKGGKGPIQPGIKNCQ